MLICYNTLIWENFPHNVFFKSLCPVTWAFLFLKHKNTYSCFQVSFSLCRVIQKSLPQRDFSCFSVKSGLQTSQKSMKTKFVKLAAKPLLLLTLFNTVNTVQYSL